MKKYRGRRTPQGNVVTVIEDGRERPLDLRNDLRNHSSEANWGYEGSGPAQTSLAICMDLLGDIEEVTAVYQGVKRAVIARIPQDDQEWELCECKFREAIDAIRAGD